MVDSIAWKYSFSGHDSFQCRQLWLKKGYDFIDNGHSFNDLDAVVKLGVGKNMVSSIRFWMKAFNILDVNDNLTVFGKKLFDNDTGFDPFLEDDASLWLLHYQLVRTRLASIYSIVFNEFRKEKIYFSKETFINYLKRRKEAEPHLPFNQNTISDDFDVFLKMYQRNSASKDIEDSFSGVLTDIEMLKILGKGKDEQYQIENNERDKLPSPIFLYAILDNPEYGLSISLHTLENEFNSPGTIFALNRQGLLNKIFEIVEENRYITFTDHAGIKELQFKKKSDPYTILANYYGK